MTLRVHAGFDPVRLRSVIRMSLKCGGEEREVLDVPVSWNVEPLIQVTPSRISLGIQHPGRLVSTSLILRRVIRRSLAWSACHATIGICL